MYRKSIYILATIIVLSLAFVLVSCSNGGEAGNIGNTGNSASGVATGGENAGRDGNETNVDLGGTELGNLIGVRYNKAIGMVWGEDFYADIRENEILHARFYPETDRRTDYVEIENAPVTDEQWQELHSAVMDILPLLKKIEKKENSLLDKLFDETVHATDGPNYNDFYLIWEEAGAVQYYNIGDDKYYKVLKLMEEIVRTNADGYIIIEQQD